MPKSILFFVMCLAPQWSAAQEAVYGISVPATITGDAIFTNGKQTDVGLETAPAAGFRAVISPSLQLGSHWFAYSSLAVYSSSYFTGVPYPSEQTVDYSLMQAFAGYSTRVEGTSILLKAGKLSSAFGLAPVEYDDARMAMLGPPPIYLSRVNLRADQFPCSTKSPLAQHANGGLDFYCGASKSYGYGLTPVTLYGIPGFEMQLSSHRFDARLQVTNSSPANPQNLQSDSQALQLTAGAGYTLHGGLHVGISGFRGPYLDRAVEASVPIGMNVRDFHASGTGIDAEWSHGAWSTEGEWQCFHFDVPRFVASPSFYGVYVQAKRILTPRAFVAMRLSHEQFGSVTDRKQISAARFQPAQSTLEVAAGYRLNRHQLLKTGFVLGNSGLTQISYPESPRYVNRVEVQLVTDLTAISKTFR